MTLPTASVVVPTLRRPQQLSRCLAALAALDYPRDRLEVLVVDDGGGGPLASILERHATELDGRLLVSDHAGPSAARNTGLEAACGEVVAFTDDDCEPAPDWLRLLTQAWRADPSRGYGGTVENALEDDLAAEVAQRIIQAGYFQVNEPGDARFLTSNNLLFPTEALRDLGGFETSLRTSEDRDLCDRWRLSGRLLEHVPQAIVRHRHAGGLREFWRQHVAYARGSRRFHVLHKERTGSLPRIDPSFYARLLRRPGEPPLASAGVMALWMAATVYGYTAEVTRTRTGSVRRAAR